jgi:hypothetical protein
MYGCSQKGKERDPIPDTNSATHPPSTKTRNTIASASTTRRLKVRVFWGEGPSEDVADPDEPFHVVVRVVIRTHLIAPNRAN